METPDLHFPPLKEFQFVESLYQKCAPMDKIAPKTRGWIGAGDDAAQFDGWLATKDLSVENVHFRLDWSTPEQAVEKHIVSNVSDISSMGGVPKIALLGICLNKNWDEETRCRIAKAVSEGFAKRNITVIGGDTVSGEVGMLSTTLLGIMPEGEPLRRNQAKVGDSVYVVGTLGKSGAGLWILQNHPEITDKFADLVDYHLNPVIMEDAGPKLKQLGVDGACMDISDGLSSELNHLALNSGVGIAIDLDSLPIDPQVCDLADTFGISPLEFALNGGEEYQLLFTTSLPDSIFLEGRFPAGMVHRIGTVVEGSGVCVRNAAGEEKILESQAWSHL